MRAGLPPRWTEVPLGELLREPLAAGRSGQAVPGGVPVLSLPALRSATADLAQSQEGPWASAAEAADHLIRPGDILMSRNGGPGMRIGRAALVRETTGPTTYPATMVRVRVDERLIDPEYLVLAWESRVVLRQIESSVRQGVGLGHIAARDLERVRLPLPPLFEQERIKTSLAFWLARVDEEEAAVRDILRRVEDLRTLVIDQGVLGRTTTAPHTDPEHSAATHRAPCPPSPWDGAGLPSASWPKSYAGPWRTAGGPTIRTRSRWAPCARPSSGASAGHTSRCRRCAWTPVERRRPG